MPVRLSCDSHASFVRLLYSFHTAGIQLAHGFFVTPMRLLERFEKRNAMFAAAGFYKTTDYHNDIYLLFYILLSAKRC